MEAKVANHNEYRSLEGARYSVHVHVCFLVPTFTVLEEMK